MKTCCRCGEEKPLNEFYTVFVKARGRSYRLGHCIDCNNARAQRYYHENRERILEKKKRQYRNDPWVKRLRALMDRCAIDFVSVDELKKLIDKAEGACWYCGALFGEAFTFDHATPVSLGGTNDSKNLRVCCLSCNSRKQDKTEAQFFMELNGTPF